MAPASRPIVAISADGSRTTYHSKRAAADATAIPSASVALAASNLALRNGFLWKYEDDPREVDMSRFQVNQPAVAAPTEAHVEQARDFVNALRGDDGQMITEMRLSDGYISATKMCQSAGKNMSDYTRLQGTGEFMAALASSLGIPLSDLTNRRETGPAEGRGRWVHPRLAINLAQWCSPSFAVKVTGLVLRYLSGQITSEESRAAAMRVNERAAPPEEAEEERRGLKRQKILNEIELEKVKHANEMAKVQSETSRLRMESTWQLMEGSKRLLDTLSTGVAPPSMTAMINIARNNLAVRCLAAVEPGENVANPAILPPVGTQPVSDARRVSVQEFGRDILGLRGENLTTGRLSVVGGKVGRKWKNNPGKGEIVETVANTGEKQWKRTFLEDGVTQTTIFTGSLDASMMANNRIKFSAVYLGTNEIGNGQAYDVWTYQLDQVQDMMREAFQD
jgi:hypothetical protein